MDILPTVAHVAIPKGIELPPGCEGDNCALFLSTLALHTSLTHERRHGGHWINFRRDRLRVLMGSKYRQRINTMIDAGFIESNERYSTGYEGAPGFSKSYRLATEYRTGKSQLHVLVTRPAIKKVSQAFEPDPTNLRRAGMHFLNCFDNFAISPDSVEDTNLSDHWDQWSIARWLNGDVFAHRCCYGRLHTLMTQLPRRARQHLQTIDGEPLSVVDVSACQPLLLGYLAACHSHHQLPANTQLPYVARFSSGAMSKLDSAVARWIELCQSRAIYQCLWNAIQSFDGPTTTVLTTASGRNVEIDLRTIPERSFKRASLIPVFDKLDAMQRNPVFKIIARDFPGIANFIVAAKQNGHQRLACLLQRTESALMIDGVGEVLAKHHANVAVAPIHDALVVADTFADTATELIREQFGTLGLQPQIKIDRCSRVSKLDSDLMASG